MEKKLIELYITKISYLFLLIMILFDFLMGFLCGLSLFLYASILSSDIIILLILAISTVFIFLINRILEKRVENHLFKSNKKINILKLNSTEKALEDSRNSRDKAIVEHHRTNETSTFDYR